MPFDDDENPKVKKIPFSKGLKIDNKKSSINSPVDTTSEFENKIKNFIENDTSYNQKIMDLAIQLKSILQDKTLSSNKTQIVKNVETEIVNNLVVLSSKMNSDENRPESDGSNSLCHILMRMLLVQRDNNNELAYKVSELEKAFFKLKLELKTELKNDLQSDLK